MSIHAISWALTQDMARSSEKFILVCLANYADESGVCYPSIARLCRDTSQDRKTVINNLKSLCEGGLLRDTQRRVGPTAGVPVYQIIGLPDASKHHYVYKLTRPDTGQYYIGKRSCEGDPEADTYRGSGKWPREMVSAGVLLIREIVSEHPTSTEALAEEMRTLRSLEDDPLLMNLETPKRRRNAELEKWEKYQKRNCSDFPVKVSQNSHEEVPFFRGSSTENGTQNHHITIKEPSGNKERASRLSAEWEPSDEDVIFCKTERPDLNVRKVAAEFRDYWIAQPGAKGRKTDWPATWRNWVRRQRAAAQGYQGKQEKAKAFMDVLTGRSDSYDANDPFTIDAPATRIA